MKHTSDVHSATGFGCALTWTPTVTMLGSYFDKRRPVANAFASARECILDFVLTPLFQFLIDSFSWRGALLILGGLQLHLCVCGMLLRPLKATGLVTRDVNGEEHSLSWQVITKDHLEQSSSSHLQTEELRVCACSEQGKNKA